MKDGFAFSLAKAQGVEPPKPVAGAPAPTQYGAIAPSEEAAAIAASEDAGAKFREKSKKKKKPGTPRKKKKKPDADSVGAKE